jgi:hypothetical protein
MIYDFAQAAVLEIHTLVGQYPVSSSLKLTTHRDIRRICTVIVYAGITLRIDADAEGGLSGTRNKNAQIGGKQHIGVFAHGVARLNGSTIERNHQCTVRRVVDGAVLGEVNAAG